MVEFPIRMHSWWEAALVAALIALLGFMAYFHAGLPSPAQDLLPLFGACLLLVLLVGAGRRRGFFSSLLRRPGFWFGVGFFLFLVLQYVNSGRTLVFNPRTGGWLLTPPEVSWLPSAVRRDEARQAVNWFAAALAVWLVVRVGLARRRHTLVLLTGLGLIALLMVVHGSWQLSQYDSGRSFWVPMDHFSVFHYQNHAGVFFVLTAALLGGGCLHAWSLRLKLWSGFLLVLFFVALAGAVLSLSRAAMVSSMLVLVAISGYALQRRLPRCSPRVVGIGLVVVVVLFFSVPRLLRATGDNWVAREAAAITPAKLGAHLFSSTRRVQLAYGVKIWLAHPLWGSGAWGFRHMAPLRAENEVDYAMLTREGSGNVHCDPVQFLSEFGLMGMGLLLGCVVAGLGPSRFHLRHPLHFGCFLGVGITLLHSLIDLPLRNPLILCLFFLSLSLMGRSLRQDAA